MRSALRGLLALAIVAISVGVAAPASADAAECGDGWWGSEHFFEPPDEYLPPPLKGFPWDCASPDPAYPVPFDGGGFEYRVLYVDIPFETVLAIFRAFEADGWDHGGAEIQQFDYLGSDYEGEVEFPVDRLVELAAQGTPSWVFAEFQKPETGDAGIGTYSARFNYADSQEYDIVGSASGAPVLEVRVSMTGPFVSGTGIGDPSVLSSLRTIAAAAPNPTQTAVLCGTSVFLMLIVGYPGALLNGVVGSRYEALRKRWEARRLARRKPGDPPPRRAPAWLVWPGFFVAAVIGSFVDPEFGFNWMSARLLVTAFWGFVLLNLVGWTIVRLVVNRVQPDAKPYIKFRWGSLVIVTLTVLLTRFLQLEPGIIFGLVAGLAFGITLAASKDALVTLVGSGFALALALVGWVGYSLMAPVVSANPGQVWAVFGSEFLAGITVEGISALPLALLPLFALDGASLFRWKKWVWAVSYVVGLAAFMLVLLTIPDAWGEIGGDFGRWLLVFVTFAVISVVLWGFNGWWERRKKRPAPAAEPASP